MVVMARQDDSKGLFSVPVQGNYIMGKDVPSTTTGVGNLAIKSNTLNVNDYRTNPPSVEGQALAVVEPDAPAAAPEPALTTVIPAPTLTTVILPTPAPESLPVASAATVAVAPETTPAVKTPTPAVSLSVVSTPAPVMAPALVVPETVATVAVVTPPPVLGAVEVVQPIVDNSPYAVEVRRLDSLAVSAVPIRAQTLFVAVKALANACGLQYLAPNEDDFKDLVTVRAAGNPWKILNALKEKYGFEIEFKDDLWTFYKPQADEIVVRTYQLRYNDLSATKITAPSINTGLSASGSSSSSSSSASTGGGGAFDSKTDLIVTGIQDLLKLPTTGTVALVARDSFVADLPDLPPPGYSVRLKAKEGASGAGAGNFVKFIPASNRLVIGAPRQAHKYVAEYLKSVDRPQRQMMVRVLFVETSANDTSGIGFNPTVAANLKLSMDGTNSFKMDHPNWVTPTGTILNTASFDMQLKALQSAGKAQIFNRATVVCVNNEETQFNSGLQIPILSASTATPSSSGSQTSNNVQYISIGIDTRVLARVLDASDGVKGKETMRLNLALTVSAQAGSSTIAGQPYPIVSERKYALPAIVRNGETLVIGGLVATDSSTTDSKVPFLGDIPVLGWLFKQRDGSKDKRILNAYITPVLDPASTDEPDVIDPYSSEKKPIKL